MGPGLEPGAFAQTRPRMRELATVGGERSCSVVASYLHNTRKGVPCQCRDWRRGLEPRQIPTLLHVELMEPATACKLMQDAGFEPAYDAVRLMACTCTPQPS